jgi:tetratricopeptide (TPR) repeat protein
MNPHEGRLALSLGYLGTLYLGRKDWPDAQKAYERQLKVSTELYGANSQQLSMPLMSLGQVYMQQGDFAKAETLFLQNLNLSQKNQGDTSIGYVMGLRAIGELYYAEKQYEKGLPFALQGVKTGEILFGPEGMQLVGSKGLVCRYYDGLSQAEKAEACDRQLIPLIEKTYGENSPVLAPALTSRAKALRALGRSVEAEGVEKRLQGLQNSTVGLN